MKFENFVADMGDPPFGMTLERRRNNGPYSPSNCEWATRKTQNRNTRHNRVVTLGGASRPLSAWCEERGVDYYRAYSRLVKLLGWEPERALQPGT